MVWRSKVQLGSKPNLGIDNTVSGQVLGRLLGHTMQIVRALQQGNGVAKGLKVLDDVASVRPSTEVRNQFIQIGAGQRVPSTLGQFHDG